MIYTRAYARLLASLLMVAAMFGVAFAAPASATHGGTHDSTENSGYSNANLLVCATGGICQSLLPGYRTTATATFNPVAAAVGPYQKSIYRVIKDDYVTGWVALNGGTQGAWIDLAGLQAMWGHGALVQVILDDPR